MLSQPHPQPSYTSTGPKAGPKLPIECSAYSSRSTKSGVFILSTRRPLLGMPHRYNIFLHESMDQLFELIKDNTFGGASITAPFKTAIIPSLDFLSEEAKAIGAVNTLLCLKEPTMDSLLDRNTAGPTVALFGENTDWIEDGRQGSSLVLEAWPVQLHMHSLDSASRLL
ncbi:hypothetical protein HZ326_12316 [Fusarium oxysporum f. sp. albedinis]|nr:hypothetical protein HZ326_12316 [Fusarium oxysporum f. sp. albedinis]